MAASLTTGMQKLQLQALAPKIAPGTKGIPTEIRTNSYKLMLRPNMPYYKYDVRMYELYPAKGEEGLKEKELCKQTRDDYTEQDRKTKTVQLLKQLCSQGKIKASLEELAYDRAAVLFSTKKLENEQTINFSPAELKAFRYEINDDCKGVKIVIKAVTEGFQLSSNDIIKAVSSRAVEQDRSILEFLNLVTSQQAFMGGNFVVYGSNAAYLYDHTQYGFTNQDVPALPEGKYMGIGGGKSVKILEGGDAKNPSPLVTIDVTKGAFHIDNQSAIEKIAAILNCKTSDLPNRIMSGRQIVTKGIKGLSFKTTYLGSKDRVFRCRGLGPVAKEAKFAVDGKEISVVAYFSQKYKKPIQYPQLPVLLSERGSFFPIELCVVAPNQRVAFANQTPAQIQVQIRACAVPPAIRMKQTHQVTGAMGLSAASDNKHLKAAGIVVDKEPVSVAARTLPLPKVRDGKNLPAIQGNCKWMVEKFITPATVPDWAIYGALSKYDSGNGLPVVENFAKTIVARGCQFGMRWGPPKELKLIDPFDLEPVFVNAEKAGLKFLMFVSSDNLTHHEFMKALELKYQILTQDVRFSKARDTSKVETIKNFVMKTNEKNGGLNYKIEDASAMLDKSILILGIEFSHPPPCPKGKEPTMPSVLGWSANCTANNQKWVGDYKFIKPRTADDRSELATPLKAIFSEAVGRFKSGRNAPPSLVMIYRNGVSEGQFGLLLEEEIPLFYDACSEMSGGKYKPELVVIAVGKDHVHRIYKKNPGNGRPAEQNIMPGTVVDKGIVSPVVNEFFLNSHSAFQGTAKTPKYTVIKNGTSKPALLSMDAIEQVTHALTYTHGIIGATISLPGVLKVAGEMAKRGAANYRSNYGETSSSGAGPANVETANAALTYSGKKLSAIRFNA